MTKLSLLVEYYNIFWYNINILFLTEVEVLTFSQSKRITLREQKEKKLFTFLLALGVAATFFVPYMILGEGYFTFYGDFNVQQIPFYQMCHQAIREGNINWNWNTDLGANFVGSYAFYLLGSPFFWITLPFPNSFVPYLMGPLLILKFACASLAAYLYIRRFTRTPLAASLGGLLYAFSGFSIYNIYFNHFHEAIIVFPLLLLSLELLINENRRGVFAVCVAVAAITNYFFFFGMVVFCVIYYFVRLFSGAIKFKLSRFLVLIFEAVLGLALAAALLVPSISAIMGNSRISNFLMGWSGITYGKEQTAEEEQRKTGRIALIYMTSVYIIGAYTAVIALQLRKRNKMHLGLIVSKIVRHGFDLGGNPLCIRALLDHNVALSFVLFSRGKLGFSPARTDERALSIGTVYCLASTTPGMRRIASECPWLTPLPQKV